MNRLLTDGGTPLEAFPAQAKWLLVKTWSTSLHQLRTYRCKGMPRCSVAGFASNGASILPPSKLKFRNQTRVIMQWHTDDDQNFTKMKHTVIVNRPTVFTPPGDDREWMTSSAASDLIIKTKVDKGLHRTKENILANLRVVFWPSVMRTSPLLSLSMISGGTARDKGGLNEAELRLCLLIPYDCSPKKIQNIPRIAEISIYNMKGLKLGFKIPRMTGLIIHPLITYPSLRCRPFGSSWAPCSAGTSAVNQNRC